MSKRAGCLVVLAVVLVVGGCLARFGGDDEQAAAPAPSVSQSVRRTPPAPEETEPTEASPTLPAGDEVTVIEVVDSATSGFLRVRRDDQVKIQAALL